MAYVYDLWFIVYVLWFMVYRLWFTAQGSQCRIFEETCEDLGPELCLEAAALLVDGCGHLHHHVLITGL